MKLRTVAAALVLWIAPVIWAQQMASVPGQGRSMVVTKLGIVAAPQFLASQAGAHVLEEGGNAVDAAIAANAVMGVVQPYVNGMGGDLFAIVYDAKTGKLYGLNSSGWTPKALTIEWMKAQGQGRDQPDRRGDGGRAGRGGGMGCAAEAVWDAAAEQTAGSGDLLRGQRISSGGAERALLGGAEPDEPAGV